MCDVCADVRPFAQSCDFEFSLSQEITEGVDAANGIGTTYTMQPGDTWNGLIDSGGDRDWIAVELIEGHVYELNVKGAPSGVGTLTDPITAIYDLNGIYLDTDDDGGYGAEAQLTWTATYSGTHYVMGRGYSAATGTYQLTLVDTSAPVIEEPYSGTVDQMATYLTNGYWSDTGSSAHRFNTAVSNQIAGVSPLVRSQSLATKASALRFNARSTTGCRPPSI